MLIRRKIRPPPPHSVVKDEGLKSQKTWSEGCPGSGRQRRLPPRVATGQNGLSKKTSVWNFEVPWITPCFFFIEPSSLKPRFDIRVRILGLFGPPVQAPKVAQKASPGEPRTPLFGGSKIAETVIYTVFEDKTRKCENNKKTIKMKTQKSPRRFTYKHFGDFSCPPKTT